MDQTHQDQTPATDKVMAFDTIFTTNRIKKLKVLLFFLDSPMQKMLAVYIKFMELKYTLSYFDKHSSLGIGKMDFNEIYTEIMPYCTATEQKNFEQLAHMSQMMDNFKHINETMEMMKDLFPDGMPGFDSASDNSGLFEMLSAMIGQPDI